MRKPAAPKTRLQTIDERQFVELQSFLPHNRAEGHGRVAPYLKSFRDENPERVIGGSKLIYTACSSKKWRAPESRPEKRVFV